MWAPTRPDFSSIAEAIFELEIPDSEWLPRTFAAMQRSMPGVTDGVVGILPGSGSRELTAAWGSTGAILENGAKFFRQQKPTYLSTRTAHPVATDWQLFGDTARAFPHTEWLRQRGFPDCFTFGAPRAGEASVGGAFLLPDRAERWPQALVDEWALVVRALTTGARLRANTRAAEGVFALDGRALDVSEAAHGDRELLRDFVRRLMRARGSSRDRENPLSARRGGRWVLLDRFESDGRHVVVAHALESPAGTLSAREQQVAELLAEGQSHKGIAATLDVSVGTVGSYAHRIYKKLGVETRVALARALSR